MALFDMPLEKLKSYRAPDAEPGDFDAFWQGTLKEASRFPLDARFERVDDPAYKLVDAWDVTFVGFGGQPIKGWLIAPAGASAADPLPCVVSYIGYSGGRSFPIDHLAYPAAGLAHLVMDTRGQGSNWSPGHTGDDAASGPQFSGFMTRGIDSPATYYYRRVFTDAVRAVQAAAAHPAVDPARIAVAGGSQGGGITLAAAGLLGDRVALALPDVPFLCHFRRATTLVDTAPYSEISSYLKAHRDKVERVFATLGYFDGVNFARRIKARCLFSVALMDTICPPSTVFAAYNEVRAPKDIRVYDFNNHEGGGVFHALDRVRLAATCLLGSPGSKHPACPS